MKRPVLYCAMALLLLYGSHGLAFFAGERRPGWNDEVSRTPIVNANLHVGWRTMGELAVGYGTFRPYNKTAVFHQVFAGTEFNFNPGNFIIGPKITYNYGRGIFFPWFVYGGSLIYYTNFHHREICLHPHIGVNWFYLFEVYLGWNIRLYQDQEPEFTNNFTATIAIPFYNREKNVYGKD